MSEISYRKLLNLKLFRKFHFLYSYWTHEKGYQIVTNVKLLMLQEGWDELWAKTLFLKTTLEKIFGKS